MFIEKDGSFWGWQQASEKRGEGGLTGADFSYDREGVCRGYVKRHTSEDVGITEREMKVFDTQVTVNRGWSVQRTVGNVRNGIEDFFDTSVAGSSALDDGDDETEGHDWPREACEGGPESDEITFCDGVLENEPSAVPEDDDHADGADDSHHGDEHSASACEG